MPVAKRAGADTIDAVRDLEMPNEDTKILERMHNVVLDECAAAQLRPLQQAFVSEGDIMYNTIGLHEEFRSSLQDRRLRLLLLMDCVKGFNYMSHSWTNRVLEHAGLPAGLRLSIQRLGEVQFSILVFSLRIKNVFVFYSLHLEYLNFL